VTVKQIQLELIDDNPYNPRHYYHPNKVSDLANSIKENGLLNTPQGREVEGRVQLAHGGYRKRAFLSLHKKEPKEKRWATLPVDILPLNEEEMFHVAMEENLTRDDITPIEVARCIRSFMNLFPKTTEEDVAKKHNMTQANVSNMVRVLRLPEQVLEKVDQGIINFTMARELLVLQDVENAKDLMLEAIKELRTGNKDQGAPVTVEGIQLCIDHVARYHFRPLEGGEAWYQKPDFDIQKTNCLACPHSITTHISKTQVRHFCADEKCWDKHQAEHREEMAKAARAKMEADLLKRAAEFKPPAEIITQEIPEGVRLAQDVPKGECKDCALATEDHTIGHKFPAVVAGHPASNLVCIKDYRAKFAGIEHAAAPVATITASKKASKETKKALAEVASKAAEQIKSDPEKPAPAELVALAKEKAGTRAEILDLKDLQGGRYQGLKEGYIQLKGEYDDILKEMDNPTECTEQCTKGFHYAFDSRADNFSRYDKKEDKAKLYFVCTDPKCVAAKKGAFTRAKNAEGMARKNAERKAIKAALDFTESIDRPRMKVIILAQLKGDHVSRYYIGNSSKDTASWFWDRLSPGVPSEKRNDTALWKEIDKLTVEEMAKIIVEFMLYTLQYKGEPQKYEIRIKAPLNWLGVTVEEAKP
jgi:ParB/RepB/Spo0J family partition protein